MTTIQIDERAISADQTGPYESTASGRFFAEAFRASAVFAKHQASTGAAAYAPEMATVEPYFFVPEGQQYVQVAYREVLYMKSQDNFLQIVTPTRTYLPIMPITKMEEQLKGDLFLRVHRSYLINRSAIREITRNKVVLVNQEIIPIGDQYRTQINRKHVEGKVIIQ